MQTICGRRISCLAIGAVLSFNPASHSKVPGTFNGNSLTEILTLRGSDLVRVKGRIKKMG